MFHPLLPVRSLRAAAVPIILGLSMLLSAHHASAQSQPLYSKVKILFDGRDDAMRQLSALGLPVDHGALQSSSFTTELSEAQIQIARDHGFSCEVLIDDVSAFYRERNAEGMPPEERADGWLCDGPHTFNVPTHFALGSMAGYYTWQRCSTSWMPWRPRIRT
jgi:hypothetical protein